MCMCLLYGHLSKLSTNFANYLPLFLCNIEAEAQAEHSDEVQASHLLVGSYWTVEEGKSSHCVCSLDLCEDVNFGSEDDCYH